ncbi:hypothetical protein niasHS_008839 [Heterodera schachtii]|uniref:Uncharacterized protein n=1 Tax=Heterodera schachtii TaxID=97005 RepID=A0ABD2IXY7_HETSC
MCSTDNKYRIIPHGKYKIVVVFYVPERLKTFDLQTIFCFQTDSKGRIKFTFDKQVFENPFVDTKLKGDSDGQETEEENTDEQETEDPIVEDSDEQEPVKVAVYVYGGEENEARLLHPYKMFEANPRRLVQTVNYDDFVADRKCNENRLHEVFQIVFKDLPLVQVGEIDFEQDAWKNQNDRGVGRRRR